MRSNRYEGAVQDRRLHLCRGSCRQTALIFKRYDLPHLRNQEGGMVDERIALRRDVQRI
jgi:hypothetical protein